MIFQKFAIDDRIEVSKEGIVRKVKTGNILKPKVMLNGQVRIYVSDCGKTITYALASIVAETYLDNPNNYWYVHHLDGDLENNHVNNLVWKKTKENIKNYKKNRYNYIKKTNKIKAVDDNQQIHYFKTQNEAAAYFSLPQPMISRALRNKTNYLDNYKFEYIQ